MKIFIFILIIFFHSISCAEEIIGNIGINFDLPINRDKGIEITYAHYLSPAYLAGLKEGDLIETINNVNIKKSNLSDENILKEFNGKVNTSINLKILRDQKKQLEFKITRSDLSNLYAAHENLIKLNQSEENKKNNSDIIDLNDYFKSISIIKESLVFLKKYKKTIEETNINSKNLAIISIDISSLEYELGWYYAWVNNPVKKNNLNISSYKNISEVYNNYPELFIDKENWYGDNLDLYLGSSLDYIDALILTQKNNTEESLLLLKELEQIVDKKIKENHKYKNYYLKLKAEIFHSYSMVYSYSELEPKKKKKLWIENLLKAEKILIKLNQKDSYYSYILDFNRLQLGQVYQWGRNPDFKKSIYYLEKVNDPELKFTALYEMGIIYIENLNKLEKGIAYLKQAKSVFLLNISKLPQNVQRETIDQNIQIFDSAVYYYIINDKKSLALELFEKNRINLNKNFFSKKINISKEINLFQIRKNLNEHHTIIRLMALNEANQLFTEKNEIRALEAFSINSNIVSSVDLEPNLSDLIFEISKKINIDLFDKINDATSKKVKLGYYYGSQELILTEEQIEAYEIYNTNNYKLRNIKNYYKVFAISPGGSYGFNNPIKNLDQAKKIALEYCNQYVPPGGTKCKIYSINEKLIDDTKQYEIKNYTELTRDEKLFKIIKYYRYLISKPIKTDFEIKDQKYLSKMFYSLILSPILDKTPYLKNEKRKLTIIPDSIFYLLPFETLIDENDNYLVENYNIYYANNLQSFNNIKQSNTANNNSLIAFGGAEYNKKNQSIKSININQIFNKTDLAQINNDVQKNINNNSTIRGDYKKLGIQNWQNLPGTLEEINKISLHMTNSKIISGKNVSEKTIKHLSESGDLSKFNIIHFATHGFLHSDIPELSALVLSQTQQSNEDNYLNIKEISNLNINADLVVLSACNTGVGTLYHGGGVINISNAFFSAGTKALIMSLWYLADNTTSLFMDELYKKISSNKYSYVGALNEVKRDFIKGKHGSQYQDPFFWSSLVYYGLDQTFN
ncbi:CHAT domain-containing protein [Pelagibacteraceae bacterium]|nr:CHAT domain-containing protein [Pelagibacteraceae bacterium]